MKALVEHDNHENRRKIEKLIKGDEVFKPYFNTTLDEQREHALRRLKSFCGEGIIRVQDFEENPMNIFMAHETFAQVDGSFATKMTVQFNLWGGTVFRLGSEEHKKKFASATNSAEVVGCFGLSELGYGNNAVEMETTATYDVKTQEFVIHSPSVLSQKYWITNGACHAHYCAVFAQLVIDGKKEGVHGFLVQIRDLQGHGGKTMPGCRVEDMGLKIGLNGIDNAKIFFDHVRIPRTDMLTSYAEVSPEGKYIWKEGAKAPSKRNRFLRLADQLLSGRLCISSMMMGGTKVILTCSLRYMLTRMGVGSSGKSDTPILDYQLCQHECFPLVARCFATQFFHNYAKRRYAERTEMANAMKMGKAVDEKKLHSVHMELVILCSSVKPIAAWLCDKSVIVCRERVGGVGFLDANGFGGMFAHAGITAEGDARVLCMKVCKELMELIEKGATTSALADLVSPKDLSSIGISSWMDADPNQAAWYTDAKKLKETCRSMESLLALRCSQSMESFKTKLGSFMMNPEDTRQFREKVFDANQKEFSDEIQAVARTYGQWESFRAMNLVVQSSGTDTNLLHNSGDVKIVNGGLSDNAILVFGRVLMLYAFDVLSEDPLTALEIFNKDQLYNIAGHKARLCKLMRPDIFNIIASLGVDEGLIWRPMAKDWKEYNRADNFGEVLATPGKYLSDQV